VNLSVIGVFLARQARLLTRGAGPALAGVGTLAPASIWLLQVVAGGGPGALADELRERGASLVTLSVLMAVSAATAAAALHALRRPQLENDPGEWFALLLAGVALLMLLGAELFYVDDVLGWRVNTVFRFWHQAWVLLSISGAFGLYWLTASWRLPSVASRSRTLLGVSLMGVTLGAAYTVAVAVEPWEALYSRWWTATPGLVVVALCVLTLALAGALGGVRRAALVRRAAWLAPTAVLMSAALVYPVLVTFDRTGGFTNPQTINGLDFARRDDPSEYEALRWLNDNVKGSPVILEAADASGDFQDASLVSSRTGLPTLIGWPCHEAQWRGESCSRGPASSFARRLEDVPRMYATTEVSEAEALVRRYDVSYVYFGRRERERYGQAGQAKFGHFMRTVFQNDAVTIYQMPPAAVNLSP
jgi:uncharacterized membrane protein